MQQWTEHGIHEVLQETFDEPPTITLTVGNLLVVVFTNKAPGDFPIVGAYWNNNEWMPCRWTKDGELFPMSDSKLNIVVNHNERESA
jgi:hypothetical protein